MYKYVTRADLNPGICIVVWGGYDEGKPRTRLLLDTLRARSLIARELNISVWAGVEDKSVLTAGRFVRAGLRLLLSYPLALARIVRMPKGTIVVLPYPAIPDIFVIWPFAVMRSWRIVLDAFIPLHEAIVVDRKLVRQEGVAGRFIWHIEQLALGRADLVLSDTDQHSEYLIEEFGLDPRRLQTVLVGAEAAFWESRNEDCKAVSRSDIPTVPADRPIVLFYGQLIPLHGVSTILEAIRLTVDEPFHWVIVGSGQLDGVVREFLEQGPAANFTWIPWIEYSLLPDLVRRATVALGVFGTGDKAGRVIPNKVFQILAAGRPVITRAGPAINGLATRYPRTIITVPSGDAAELARTVREVVRTPDSLEAVPESARQHLGPADGVDGLLSKLTDLEEWKCKQR